MTFTIKTEIIIQASPARVWQVLTNLQAYSNWNPFIVNAMGEVKLGEQLLCQPKLPSGGQYTFKPTVTRCEEEKVFAWTGDVIHPKIASGEHLFIIEKLGDEKIKLFHDEVFTGVFAPLVMFFVKENTRKGFELMNEALKLEAEKPYYQ